MDTPLLDSQRGTPIPPPPLPSHDDFVSDDVDYYNDDMQTHVTRCPLPKEPAADPEAHTFYSLEDMLRDPSANRKKIDHAAFSHLAVADFEGEVTYNRKTYKVRNNYFHHTSATSFEGKQYRDDTGKIHRVYHSITSSWDRSSDDSHMAKVLVDNAEGRSKGESICYGSRPDTDSRARTQAEDIFRTEKASHKKGLLYDPKTKEYTLTYVVDSLTNPVKIQNPSLLDERTSLLDEMQALSELKKKPLIINIDGKDCIVNVRPIHVHHTLSVFGELGRILPDSLNGKDVEREINKKGYESLIKYAGTLPKTIDETLAKTLANTTEADRKEKLIGEADYKKKLIADTVTYLQDSSLSVSERLIIVDFLTRICDLPIVHHCKSIVDRTSVASSVAMANHFIKHDRLIDVPIDDKGRFAIHHLLTHPEYKKFFVSFMNINHQVSRDARLGIRPDGSLVGRAALGLNLKSGLLAATGALPFFPDKDKKPSILTRGTKSRVAALAALALFLPLLVTVYYVALILGTIPVARKFKKKSGSYQIDFFKMIWSLPFRVKWLEIQNLNFAETFNLDSDDINGDGRHLLVAAKHVRDHTKADPRYRLIDEHLHPRRSERSAQFKKLPTNNLVNHLVPFKEGGVYKRDYILDKFIEDYARDFKVKLPKPTTDLTVEEIITKLQAYISREKIEKYLEMADGLGDSKRALTALANIVDQLSEYYGQNQEKIFECLALITQSHFLVDEQAYKAIEHFKIQLCDTPDFTKSNNFEIKITPENGLIISGKYQVIHDETSKSRTLETRVYLDKGRVDSRFSFDEN